MSVWFRRLFYLGLLVTFLLAAARVPLVVVVATFLVAGALQPCWQLTVRRAPVYQDTRWIGPTIGYRYIIDPVLRRQHRRDVLWLPRR
jgi:hypothetical protein